MGAHYFLEGGRDRARLLENFFVHVMGMRTQFNIIGREAADHRVAMNILALSILEFC